jgi:hypothetical protein
MSAKAMAVFATTGYTAVLKKLTRTQVAEHLSSYHTSSYLNDSVWFTPPT